MTTFFSTSSANIPRRIYGKSTENLHEIREKQKQNLPSVLGSGFSKQITICWSSSPSSPNSKLLPTRYTWSKYQHNWHPLLQKKLANFPRKTTEKTEPPSILRSGFSTQATICCSKFPKIFNAVTNKVNLIKISAYPLLQKHFYFCCTNSVQYGLKHQNMVKNIGLKLFTKGCSWMHSFNHS